MRVLITSVLGGAIVAASRVALAQSALDTVGCSAKLSAASTDSLVVQLSIRVANFDKDRTLAVKYQTLFGEGIRQVMTMPRSLSLDVYQSMNKEAWPTIMGVYRATLHSDGRVSSARTVGGTRTRALDSAVVAAITDLGVSQLLPPVDSASMGQADSIDLRIVVAPGSAWSTKVAAPPMKPVEGSTPLLRIRVPFRGASGPPHPMPGSPHPTYPSDLRSAGIQGETVLQFVIGANGIPDPSSVQAMRATAVQFVSAALDVLPRIRFDPLKVEGCAVASLVQMPFQFSLTRPE